MSRVPLGVLRVPLGKPRVPLRMPRVPPGVPKNFGCYVIVDKGKFINNLFKINFTSTYTVLSKYNIHKMIISPSRMREIPTLP